MNNFPIQDKGDAFDYAFALYTWLSHWHDGQWGDRYAAMSKMISEYKLSNVPDIGVDDPEPCEDYYNAVMIYHEITESNWTKYFNDFCYYMDNYWDDE